MAWNDPARMIVKCPMGCLDEVVPQVIDDPAESFNRKIRIEEESEMKNHLSRRRARKSALDGILRILVLMYLSRKARTLSEIRGIPVAVFANDWIGANIFVDGVYEHEHIEDLFSVLDEVGVDCKNSCALDVGANIGNHSIQFARKFRRVEAFEPNPRTYAVLGLNTQGLKNIRCHNIGIGSRLSTCRLHEDLQNLGGSSTVYRHDGSMSVDCQIKTLDEVSADFGPIGLIKIDIEGMEYDALTGMTQTLDQHKPVVCFEQLQEEFADGLQETRSIEYLRLKGYEMFHLRRPARDGLASRFKNLYHLLFGMRIREVVRSDRLVKGRYSMIFAVHEEALGKIG